MLTYVFHWVEEEEDQPRAAASNNHDLLSQNQILMSIVDWDEFFSVSLKSYQLICLPGYISVSRPFIINKQLLYQ